VSGILDSLTKIIKDISSELHLLFGAAAVSITFEFQKHNIRNDMISHQQSGDTLGSGEMCPVRAAAEIITWIHSYNIPKDQIKDTPINSIQLGSMTYTIPSSLFLIKICSVVKNLGFKKLGFHPEEVGTHSNRSGGAMGMFLTGTPVYTIMLMGCWSSDVFMRYLRKQVLSPPSLSHGIATKMLSFEEFYTVPDFVHTQQRTRLIPTCHTSSVKLCT
jgi:hypothetical protein